MVDAGLQLLGGTDLRGCNTSLVDGLTDLEYVVGSLARTNVVLFKSTFTLQPVAA